MENINLLKKKLQDEASLKKNVLVRFKKTYDIFKENAISEVFNDETISNLEHFFIYERKMNDITIQGIKGKGIAVHIDNKRIELTAGNKINSLEELDVLLKAIRDYYGEKNGNGELKFIEISVAEEEYYKLLIEDYNEMNAKYIYDLFIKLYEEKQNGIKKIQNFIDLIDDYIKSPSNDKYVYLMNNRPFMNSEDTKILKRELNKFLVQEKHESQKLVSIYSQKNLNNDNYKYVDDETIYLSSKAQNQLNEIYSFVKELDKEELKEFASDPMSYFSYIDDEKENIIHNFAVLLNNDDTILYNKTIIKRLGFKIKG